MGHTWARSNADSQSMPRAIVTSHFVGTSAAQPAALHGTPADALAMHGVRLQMPDTTMLRRTDHALADMPHTARTHDFYTTKCHATPMAQLQRMVANAGLGCDDSRP